MYDFWRRLSAAFARGDLVRNVRAIDRWGRAASLGVTAVLLASTLAAYHAAAATGAAALLAERATALNESLQSARAHAALEESLERKYRLEPGLQVLQAHRQAANSLASDMQRVAQLGDAGDRVFAKAIERADRAYLRSTALMFAAVRRHDTADVLALDHSRVDPALEAISTRIQTRAVTQQLRTSVAWAAQRTLQRRAIQVSSTLSLLGTTCVVVVFFIFGAYRRSITALHAAELRQLEEAALTDNLTKLGNHRAYQEDLHREISRAKRHGHALTLALIDVDDLKLLNDQNGHLHGDRVLGALGSLLATLRDEDRAYRIGGDEFSVLFAETSRSQARDTMERLRLRAQETLLGGTISGGIATLTPESDAETLHAQADAALYAAKRGGRNGLTLYEDGAPGLSVVSPLKVGGLRRMLADRALSIVFQPIWDVKSAAVLAYEALARPASGYGFAGPQEAFDLAERVGRAHELDALARQATLARASALPPGALLFINMSPQSLGRRRLDIASFTAEVRAAGLTPERIVIEITERSIGRLDDVLDVAKELQNAGFRLALDDVGSGNAGLEMLTELNVDFVKIDRGIIVKAASNPNARGVLAGIIVIAKSTGAYVIAEGIESVEMLELVCRARIDWSAMERGIQGAQGYLLRRPSARFLSSHDETSIRAVVKDALAAQDSLTLRVERAALDERWEQFA